MEINEIEKEISKIERTTFGISVPKLRNFAKKIAKENYKKFLDENPKNTFKLKMLHAMVLGYANDDIDILLKYFEEFIPYVDSWAVCDTFCQSFLITRKYPEKVFNMLKKYFKSKKEFESRVVSVMLLSHFLNDKYIEKVFNILDKLDTNDYYSKMGVAWAIATIAGKYPEKCLHYLQNNNLDKATFNKSLQKMRESFRVTKEIKEIIKNYKKN